MVDVMDLAVTYAIYKSPTESEIISNATEIMSNIFEAFEESIQKNKWLDAVSKWNIYRKAAMIRTIIGYPSWLFNDNKQLDLYYKDVCNFPNLNGKSYKICAELVRNANFKHFSAVYHLYGGRGVILIFFGCENKYLEGSNI